MLTCQKTPGCMKVGDHAGNCDAPPKRECTPTTDEVRLRYGSLGYDEEFFEDEGEVFDRWMAEVERAAAARALEEAARAAQGAAPQVDEEHFHIWSELPCKPGQCRMEHTPVLPSSGVDEDALAEVIASVTDLWDDPLDEVHDIPQITRAVAEWLKEQGNAARE